MGRVDRVKQRTKTSKKKRFYGNRFTIAKVAAQTQNQSCNSTEANCSRSFSDSISHTKVLPIDCSTPVKEKKEKLTGYRFMDMEILSSVFNTLCCPKCKNDNLTLQEDLSQKKGLACTLILLCKCGHRQVFLNSESCEKSYDINRRLVYSMRSIGQGYGGIQKFTSLMDMPKPMTQNNYDKIIVKLKNIVKSVAEETMSDAVEEIKEITPVVDDYYDTSISCDGSWQRRGYSSLNGVVTVISMDTGKVLDCEPMCRKCKACNMKEPLKKTDPEAYNQWLENHACKINYQGSAPGMELTGAKRIFERSIEKHNLRYKHFYGDGDSKSFTGVKDTYQGIKVVKMECVGHVQKRVGTRLRNLKKNVKGLGGKGKLTNAIIDRLQNYYGIAIRSNVNDLEGMQEAILATLFHVASSEKNNWHDHCPPGESSWCKFNRDKACGTNTYKPQAGLPLSIVSKLKPIYADLSQTDLLEKCLHGKTQNQNESFNGTIWERLPKTKYVSRNQLEIGVYDAVANFNVGRKASVLIYEKLKMIPGKYTLQGCSNLNKRRLNLAKYKNSSPVKKRRKILRGKTKSKDDVDVEKEGCSYEAGGF